MIDELHERKFEIDSSANVLRLQNGYLKETDDQTFIDFNYFKSLEKILNVYHSMQNDQSYETTHSF